MKIGIFVFLTGTTLDVAELARKAEELGFDSFWIPEHPVMPVQISGQPDDFVLTEVYNRIVDPFVTLARASAVTKTIKLGTGICLVPERNPLLLAKEVATLDLFSQGRFVFGIGTGDFPEETEVMGGDFQHRWTQTYEAILAMKELWAREESEFHGNYFDFPPVRCFPKPVQKPHPPIFLGGATKNVFKRIVEWGDGWLPYDLPPDRINRGRSTLNDLAIQAGRDPRSFEVLVVGGEGGLRTKRSIEEMEEAGADGVAIWLTQAEGNAALAEMEEIARTVMSD